jgi:hypothetical protein
MNEEKKQEIFTSWYEIITSTRTQFEEKEWDL